MLENIIGSLLGYLIGLAIVALFFWSAWAGLRILFSKEYWDHYWSDGEQERRKKSWQEAWDRYDREREQSFRELSERM
jgi:hypothetical protein